MSGEKKTSCIVIMYIHICVYIYMLQIYMYIYIHIYIYVYIYRAPDDQRETCTSRPRRVTHVVIGAESCCTYIHIHMCCTYIHMYMRCAYILFIRLRAIHMCCTYTYMYICTELPAVKGKPAHVERMM